MHPHPRLQVMNRGPVHVARRACMMSVRSTSFSDDSVVEDDWDVLLMALSASKRSPHASRRTSHRTGTGDLGQQLLELVQHQIGPVRLPRHEWRRRVGHDDKVQADGGLQQ